MFVTKFQTRFLHEIRQIIGDKDQSEQGSFLTKDMEFVDCTTVNEHRGRRLTYFSTLGQKLTEKMWASKSIGAKNWILVPVCKRTNLLGPFFVKRKKESHLEKNINETLFWGGYLQPFFCLDPTLRNANLFLGFRACKKVVFWGNRNHQITLNRILFQSLVRWKHDFTSLISKEKSINQRNHHHSNL